MKFKRILAALLCAVILTGSVFANAEAGQTQEAQNNAQETQQQENTADDKSQSGETDSDTDTESISPGDQISPNAPGFLRPDEYYSMLFRQILDLYVEKHLYESTDKEVLLKMIDNMISDNPYMFKYFVNSMLGTLDPYSSYHEADSGFLKVDNTQNGYGITISNSINGTQIASVLPDSPAQVAGLKPGDEIVSICGYDVKNLPQTAVMIILSEPHIFAYEKGEDGKYPDKNPEIQLVIQRMGVERTVTMKKGPLTTSQISGKILEDGKTAYVVISSFLGETTDVEFNNLITAYSQNGIENLTIDLRDNGGGSLQLALNMAETFVDNGALLCYYNDRSLEEPTPIYSTTPKISFDSITILINNNTASASELFTRILQTKGLVKTIGERTVGKTRGQSVYTLPNNDYITITTYEMLDENLENYGEFGIQPDLEIENVKLLFEFPKLGIFNHQNYVETKSTDYSEVTKALEDRLVLIGLMNQEDADGYFDDTTRAALRIYQRKSDIKDTGECTYDTVTKITATVNSYKYYTYYEDSQYDVAMIVHSSFSQGKRLVKEKQKLAEKHAELIAAKEAEIEAELDRLEKEAEAKEQAEADNQEQNAQQAQQAEQ